MKTRSQGLTLVELMITIVVAAVILAIAVPAMETVSLSSRSYNVSNQLYQDLLYSRQLAASYQNPVTLCHLGSGGCDGNWSQGYTVFIDNDDNQAFNSGDEKLLVREPLEDSDRLNFGVSLVRFNGDGSSNSSGDFVYCPASANTDYIRTIRVSSSGMVQNLGAVGSCS